MARKKSGHRLVRLPEVKDRMGIAKSKTRIYDLMQQGQFPRPIQLGPHSVAWIEEEVIQWINSRIEASRGKTSAK